MSLILPTKDDNRLRSAVSVTLLSGSQAQALPRKPFPPKGDNLHIWIGTPCTRALTDWGPRATKVCSWGNVGMSFIAFIYETGTTS